MTEANPNIPGYTIEHLVGEGGMARVYLAIQHGFERPVALKVMAEEVMASAELGQRFLREARIVGLLSHPHIVPVYDVGEHQGVYYLAMEMLAEGDLRARMRAGLGESEAFGIARQLAGALGYAHRKGFIHRDVKPDNVLFRDADTAVLTDFGIARAAGASQDLPHITQVQSVIGSPRYMSPEQSLGQPLDARTDIYSLGILLYQMLTGEVPYGGRGLSEILLQRFEQPRPQLPAAQQHLQPLLDRLLAYDREQRFGNCEELLAAMASPTVASTVVSAPVLDTPDLEQTAILDLAPGGIEQTALYPQPAGKVVSRLAAVVGVLAALALLSAVLWYVQHQDTVAVEAGSGPPVAQVTTGQKALPPAPTPIPRALETALSGPEPATTGDGAREGAGPAAASAAGDGPALLLPPASPSAVDTPEPAEFFAFYDAVNSGLVGVQEHFIAAYPGSFLADMLRAKLGSDERFPGQLQQQAAAGSARAQLVLSELYDTGWGVGQNRERALVLATQAAGSGAPFALYHRAVLLLDRAQTDGERREGLRVLEQSARQGFYLAQTVLANHLFEGRVLGRDIDESLRLLAAAGAQGDRNALFNLGRIYDGGLNLDAADAERAQEYFAAAARLGHPRSQDYLREP
ncbi:MAG: serine/threonine-protein kinase [Parahaliea sp.]